MKERIKEALGTGYKASSVLKEVLEEVANELCNSDPERLGPECGECIVCLAKELTR